MKKKKLLSTILLSMCCIFATTSCQDDKLLNDSAQEPSLAVSPQTRAVTPYEFNWENADWMPTPTGQSKIPVPWIGQGSLASFYGLDIINDRKKSDGWELLYSTFDPNSSGEIKYPYFILYNKYRGLMRIFYYTTGDIIAASTYLQDGLTINSSNKTSLLNFLGEEIVDASQHKMQYQQIQPAPLDGSMPLAGRRWYMMQYELAYDPNLPKTSSNDMQLIWHLNYYNVDSISLGGKIEGKINGTIGAAADNNPFSGVTNLGKIAGKGALAAAGMSVLKNNSSNTTTGENTLGLSKDMFKAVFQGTKKAISSATSDIPGAILSIIFGGSTTPTPISLNIDAQIRMKGTSVQSGSFPSTSISFWIPGTIIPPDANGYIPLHGENLGVINFIGKPDIVIEYEDEETMDYFDPQVPNAPINYTIDEYWYLLKTSITLST